MAKVNVLQEILQWTSERPSWQRDALRRLVTHGKLNETDIKELAELCKADHGLVEPQQVKPLASDHLPSTAAAAIPVTLTSLIHHSGVNALAGDQTIEFGPALTVVYGANAAGKSGYTRILKRACRARGAEEILGNVTSGSAPGQPSATIRFCTDGASKEVRWDDDAPADRFLSRVSVFDRHCASVYVAEQTDVAFRPLGLALFDQLSDACGALRQALDRERRELEASSLPRLDLGDGTDAHKLMARLTSLTDPASVRALALLSPEEMTRIEALQKHIRDLQSDEPQKTAHSLELRAGRLSQLAERLRLVEDSLTDAAAEHAASVRNRMWETQLIAEGERGSALEQQPLPDTGSDAWRAMWAAAERFSNTGAYPDHAFPVTDPDARCVLCQQHLAEEAANRFHRFRDFLRSEAQRARDEAASALDRLRTSFDRLVVLDDATSEALEELRLEDARLADEAASYLSAAERRRQILLASLSEAGASPDLSKLPAPPNGLAELADALRVRAQELRADDRTQAAAGHQAELRELEARRVLAAHQDAILAEIERKKRVAAYHQCIEETNTAAITRKSTEVTKAAVTGQLTTSFREELQRLGFRHVEVEMVAAGGSRGAMYHRLQLRRAPGIPVPSVVSEGEARCLSIASFFAELSTAADRSAILFDDPVSSLDHVWRAKVAERLVEEATSRQVVVFTHDIVFLVALTECAERASIDVSHQSLRRGSTVAGLSERAAPYDGMKVTARIGYLKDLLQAAARLYRENKPKEYEAAGIEIYGLLRRAWERAVEEVLLNGVVERYRKSIETKRARSIGNISPSDCDVLEREMTKCCKWEGGHDHAAAEGAQFPSPGEIESDISALDGWVKAIRKKHNQPRAVTPVPAAAARESA